MRRDRKAERSSTRQPNAPTPMMRRSKNACCKRDKGCRASSGLNIACYSGMLSGGGRRARLVVAQLARRDHRETQAATCVHKAGVVYEAPLIDPPLHQAVVRPAVPADQGGIRMSRMAGQFHKLPGNTA